MTKLTSFWAWTRSRSRWFTCARSGRVTDSTTEYRKEMATDGHSGSRTLGRNDRRLEKAIRPGVFVRHGSRPAVFRALDGDQMDARPAPAGPAEAARPP